MRCNFFTKHALCNKHSEANTSHLNVEVEAVPQKQQPLLLLMICFLTGNNVVFLMDFVTFANTWLNTAKRTKFSDTEYLKLYSLK